MKLFCGGGAHELLTFVSKNKKLEGQNVCEYFPLDASFYRKCRAYALES
jgi:hypothetical protein